MVMNIADTDKDRHFRKRNIDADLARHRLVLAYYHERQPETGPPQPPADEENDHREAEQVLVDQRSVERHEDVAAHGVGFVDLPPHHQLTDHLGEAEAKDDKEHSGDAQGQDADHEREQGSNAERDREGRVERHHFDQHRDRIHADAEERRGCERDQPGRAGKQSPGHGQHEVAHHADHE